MTVLEGIQKSADFLAKKGVDSPRLQAELLLAHLLKMPRMKLYLNFEHILTPAETDSLRDLVKRRGQREPLQHITGETSFWGYTIATNEHALVPRPETELLAELGWQFLAGLETKNPTALDFGTGTGCIAITLAAKCPTAQITALDISPQALALAKDNAARNQTAAQITFQLSDGFAALSSDAKFDLIISNPPYIATAEIATLEPEVRDFDPKTALDGGTDGLDFYRRLANEADKFLNPGGKFMAEFGDNQENDIKSIFESKKWIVEEIKDDYSQRARMLVARR